MVESAELPREWVPIARTGPDLPGGDELSWEGCRRDLPCRATTWAPVEWTGDRPTVVLMRSGKVYWDTARPRPRWRTSWSWIDAVLGACLQGAEDPANTVLGVDRRLIERSDGFWWELDFTDVGPCDLSGGLALATNRDKGELHKLVAARYRWGSPEAVDFVSAQLHAQKR